MEITLHYLESYHQRAIEFDNAYEHIAAFTCPDELTDPTTPAAERKCRFWCKRYPHVGFSSRPHVIPHALGNQYWISDFECDSCNALFGRREGDLTYFLGVSRTLNETIGKKGVPRFEAAGSGIYAEKINFLGMTDAITIGRKSKKAPFFGSNQRIQELKVTYKKPGYIPINVYKAFLKIALSVIPEQELTYYRRALAFLQARSKAEAQLHPAMLWVYAMPLGFGPDSPAIMLYKKKRPGNTCPTHYMNLFYKNFSFHLHLPLHDQDMHLYSGKEQATLICCPPLFSLPYKENSVEFQQAQIDLSSYELKQGEEEELTVKFQGDPENLVAIDPNTFEIINDPKEAKIQQLYIITDPNFSIPLKEKTDDKNGS